MKNNRFILPLVLIAVLFFALLGGMLVQIFLPAVIVPPLNIPNVVLLSVVTLLIEYGIFKSSTRCFLCDLLFGVAAFMLLPLMAGFADLNDFWRIGLVGGVTFALTAFLFASVTTRLKTGPKAPAALILTGFGIYLASQCFAGILL